MRLPSRRRLKKELNRKLIYHPLLRMLLLKFWFRVAFLICILFGVFLSLYLPKIYRTSPDGFRPVIRVSALDLTQAWSLKRSALAAGKAGRVEEATYSWQAAVANNPADETLVRGLLEDVLRRERTDGRLASVAISQTFWLMRLTGTNTGTLDLSLKIYEKFRYYDLVLYALQPWENRLSPTQEASYQKALYNQGKMTELGARLALGRPAPASDEELPLYRLAYTAGWGQEPQATLARTELKSLLESSPHKILANRLNLLVAIHLVDPESYAVSLQRLTEAHVDFLIDHIGYWRLLLLTGRKEEAAAAAQASPNLPASSVEVVRLADIYTSLGLEEQAHQLFRNFTPQFGHSADVWVAYATFLIERKEWEELRTVFLDIRQHPSVRETLEGYTYYLEGRSELGRERRPTAEVAFEKAAEANYDNPHMAVYVADQLNKLDYPKPAWAILQKIEKESGGSLNYWEAVFAAALALKDSELVLKAATKIYQKNPADKMAVNRYAAALLLNRAKPEEAVKLTLDLVSFYPNSLTAVVNHSLALLLNQRTQEARANLLRIDPTLLAGSEANAYYLVLFEVLFNMGEFEQALRVSNRIQKQILFPNQTAWLESKLKEMQTGVAKVS